LFPVRYSWTLKLPLVQVFCELRSAFVRQYESDLNLLRWVGFKWDSSSAKNVKFGFAVEREAIPAMSRVVFGGVMSRLQRFLKPGGNTSQSALPSALPSLTQLLLNWAGPCHRQRPQSQLSWDEVICSKGFFVIPREPSHSNWLL